MKRYILTALAILAVFASCKEQHGTIFDKGVTGVYFSPVNNVYYATRNFADYYTAHEDTDSARLVLKLTVNTLGHVDATRDRVAVLRAKPLLDEDTNEYYEDADLTFDEHVIIPAGAIQANVLITLNRPEIHHETGAILYFDTTDPASDFGPGIMDRCEFTIVSSFSYKEPSSWKAVKEYYGEYSQDKHIFLLSVLGNGFYSTSNSMDTHIKNNYNAVLKAREAAQNRYAGRNVYVADIPFHVREYYGSYGNEKSYGKPWYWNSLRDSDRNEIDPVKYFGDWFPEDSKNDDMYDRSFAMFAQYADLNTANEREFFSDYINAHKTVIKCMIDTYNGYFNYPTRWYKPAYDNETAYYMANGGFRCASPIPTIDYSDPEWEVVPAQWEGEAGKLVEAYYGEYSWAKMCFIIQNLLPAYPQTSYFPRIFCVSSCYKDYGYQNHYEISYAKWPERRNQGSDDKDGNNSGDDVPYHSEQAQLEEYSKFLHDKAKAAGFDWPDDLPEIKPLN